MPAGMAYCRTCRTVSSVLVTSIFLSTLTMADPEILRDPGDVILAAMFNVRKAVDGGGEQCGDYVAEGLVSVHAVQWFLRTLNEGNYIPGVTIGLEARMMCHSPERARSQALELLDTYVIHHNDSLPPLFGVVGPTSTSTALAVAQLYSSLPAHQRVPLVSGSATGVQLRNYKNFFRVIPPDDVQIEALTALLVELEWNYVAIVYSDDNYGRTAALDLRERASQAGVCFPVFWSVGQMNNVMMFSLAGTPDQSRVAGVVFIGGQADAHSFLSSLENVKAANIEVIFSEAVGLRSTALEKSHNPKPQPYDVARGSMAVSPPYWELAEFREAWNALWVDCNNLPPAVTTNPWLLGAKDLCQSLPQDGPNLFPWYHVQAAAVLAATLKELHATHCGNLSGSCPDFRAAVREYDTTLETLTSRAWNLSAEFSRLINGSMGALDNVRFGEDGEMRGDNSSLLPLYEVYNFLPCEDRFCFKQVGNYTAGRVTLTWEDIRHYDISGRQEAWPNLTQAQCEPGRDCSECRGLDLADVTMIIPGDFYVVVVVPVHTRDPDDPFLCAKPRGSLGADFVQAVMYALDEVNAEGGRWEQAMPGSTLGAIFLDSCYSPPVTKSKLLNLHKGRIKLAANEGAWLDEAVVKTSILPRIAGYLGGFFSTISLAMSDVLTEIERQSYVHLSPTSVSSELSDREKHPFFLRVVESASTEVLAMLDLLRYLQAGYVQIIYNPWDPYTKGLADDFKKHSMQFGVCVAQEITINLRELDNPTSRIIETLRKKVSARMVVVILQYQQILQLMDSMDDQLHQEDAFLFLGSDAWANRLEVIRGRRRLAGSITISEEIALDANFTSYFRAQDPLHSPNVWLKDFWEERNACYLNLSMSRAGRSPCPWDYRASYQQDPWIPFYIQALRAFATGVGNALSKACGVTIKDICTSLKSKAMVNEMKQVKLDLFGTGQASVFDANGNGRIGYNFMQAYWNSSTGMQYRRIGKWDYSKLSLYTDRSDLEDKLPAVLDDRYRNYRSSCPNAIDCCPSPHKVKTSEDSEEAQVAVVPVAAGFAALGIALIVFIIITVIVSWRHRQFLRSMAREATTFQLTFENAGMSHTSSETSSNAPIQEMFSGGGPPTPRTSIQPSSDYAFIRDLNDHTPPPRPCGAQTKGSDYLTVIDRPI